MEPIELVVPMPPNINARFGHYMARHHEKKQYYKRLDELQNAGVIPPPPMTPIAKATAAATMYLGHEMDDDNAMRRAYKAPLDWLKSRGYIVDDRRKCVRCAVPEQVVKRDGNYRVRLTITPL